MIEYSHKHNRELMFLINNLDIVGEPTTGLENVLKEPYGYDIHNNAICMPDIFLLYRNGSIRLVELKHSAGLYEKAKKQLLSGQEFCEREFDHRVVHNKKVVYYHKDYRHQYENVDEWKINSNYPHLVLPNY